MTDILQDMADLLVRIDDGEIDSDDLDPSTVYIMISRAVGEIERLRKQNIEQGWRLNPDRSGGQFAEEEINRTGWL
jgi:hypothetical protein